jgi:hypothetical protein
MKPIVFAALVGILVTTPLTVSATPQVSDIRGTLAHGEVVEVIGSDFGAKSPAKPYLWAPFDNSAAPSSLGVVTAWSGTENMQFAPGEGVSGSGALRASNGSGIWTARVDASGFAWNDYGQKTYLYRRVKRNFAISDQMNWKNIRFWPGDRNPNWYYASSNCRLYVEGTGAGSWVLNCSPTRNPANEWRVDEFILQANTAANRSDGIFIYNADSMLVESLPRSDTDGWKVKGTTTDNSAAMVQAFPVHGVMANYDMPSDFRYWVDDVYLDTTWARVMVGDAPTLSASRHLEIQIPTAWSSDSITVQLNTVAFPTDALPYLFIVDADNNASSGFPLFGSRPKPPSDVRVESVGISR